MLSTARTPLPVRPAWTIVLVAGSLALPLAPQAAERGRDPVPRWNLVWADEFDRDGPPDPRNWTHETGLVRNQELQWYQPENARCEHGRLVIEARRERKRNPAYHPGSSDWRRNREYGEYTSASLLTRGLHHWRYGRFEMSARIDPRPGSWPAFWTLGIAGEWPACGEIDIMEYYRGMLLANAAWGTEDRWVPRWASVKKPISDFTDRGWSNKFHLWRLEVYENRSRLE